MIITSMDDLEDYAAQCIEFLLDTRDYPTNLYEYVARDLYLIANDKQEFEWGGEFPQVSIDIFREIANKYKFQMHLIDRDQFMFFVRQEKFTDTFNTLSQGEKLECLTALADSVNEDMSNLIRQAIKTWERHENT